MSWIHNFVVAAMPTTVLLLPVPIWPRGHHLTQRPSLVTGDECSQSHWQNTGMGTSSAGAATWLERSPLIFQSLKPWLESISGKELESSVEVLVALQVALPKSFWPCNQAGWMGEAIMVCNPNISCRLPTYVLSCIRRERISQVKGEQKKKKPWPWNK
jgi:hypothetical protein